MLAHEADHWNFLVHELPALQRAHSDRPFQQAEIIGAAEKRAYDITYRIERNLGYFANMMSLEAAAESYRGLSPYAAHRIISDLAERRDAAGHPDRNRFNVAYGVGVAALLYGDSSPRVTEKELSAFRLLGAI